jgi:hypothetical protein
MSSYYNKAAAVSKLPHASRGRIFCGSNAIAHHRTPAELDGGDSMMIQVVMDDGRGVLNLGSTRRRRRRRR